MVQPLAGGYCCVSFSYLHLLLGNRSCTAIVGTSVGPAQKQPIVDVGVSCPVQLLVSTTEGPCPLVTVSEGPLGKRLSQGVSGVLSPSGEEVLRQTQAFREALQVPQPSPGG